MKLFCTLTGIAGGILAFGAAGADQMYTEWGQVPPETVWQVFVIGLVLMIPALIYMERKVKK